MKEMKKTAGAGNGENGRQVENDRSVPVIGRKGRAKGLAENLMLVILAFYPLRHIHIGLDLWDTGYNYANFAYAGTEHMDSMWLFSTYLANVVGNFLTRLPNGKTLAGMNFYTGLFVSLLAVAGYLFCTRAVKMSAWTAFFGELAALSLCWCPTAKLYDYLTYVLFLAAVILLYYGLTGERRVLLLAAGVCLGCNVLVRFSNLPEAAMILAVWAYDLIVYCRRERKTGFWKQTLRHTGWCLLGYVSALCVLLGYIALRYGLAEYVNGILRLFAMTDKATDYKATSMLTGMLGIYVENLYWVLRIGVIVAGGMTVSALLGGLEERVTSGQLRLLEKRIVAGENVEAKERARKWGRGLRAAEYVFSGLLGAAMLCWLYARGFCSLLFYSYDCMLRPGILFLMLTMAIAIVRVAAPRSTEEEKLLSGMVLLVILLTSLGSNNGVYPSLNNLFLAAPYTLWEVEKFVRGTGKTKIAHVIISPAPAKGVLAAFLLLCAVQFGGFGVKFVFAEATGVQHADAAVENNEVLKNIRMSADKAKLLTDLSRYVNENQLQGQEVILYGDIPALAYYLQLPPAFNSWCDLDSYSSEAMRQELAAMEGEKPVIILANAYAAYLEGGESGMQAADVPGKVQEELLVDEKWSLLVDFMTERGYEQGLRTERVTLYRAE